LHIFPHTTAWQVSCTTMAWFKFAYFIYWWFSCRNKARYWSKIANFSLYF